MAMNAGPNWLNTGFSRRVGEHLEQIMAKDINVRRQVLLFKDIFGLLRLFVEADISVVDKLILPPG